MHPAIERIERAINQLTSTVRAHEETRREDSKPWWVVAVGEQLDPDDFKAREASREALLLRVAGLGVAPRIYEWVWDETDRVQLVMGAFTLPDDAREYAAALEVLGIEVRVIRRFE
jgi:hypothetical protein